MKKFILESTIISPEKKFEIKNAVILLHGYGGDGNDISMLAYNWKRYLSNTIFICPNGHETCGINPGGYQWFDLSVEDESYILDQSLKAEKILNEFIKEIKNEFNLKNNQICLSGFSQGCMMSINLGLVSESEYNCIVGFSGKIINKKNLENRIKTRPKILLIHGDMDNIVPPNNLLDSKDFLLRQKVEVNTKIIHNCEHNIPVQASSLALNFISSNFN